MITYHNNELNHYYHSILTPALMLTKNKIIIPFFSVGKFGLLREVAIKWRVRREIQGLYWERESSFSTKKWVLQKKSTKKNQNLSVV